MWLLEFAISKPIRRTIMIEIAKFDSLLWARQWWPWIWEREWKRHSDHLRDGSGVPPELLTTDLDDEILDDTYYPSQSNSVPSSDDPSMDYSPDISLQQSSTVSSQNEVSETQSGTESTSRYSTRICKPPNHYSWILVVCVSLEGGNVVYCNFVLCSGCGYVIALCCAHARCTLVL